MAHTLVKFFSDDDGRDSDSSIWHLVTSVSGGACALCTLEFFGEGESSVVYETKRRERGGISCPECMKQIRTIKSVKL